MKLVVISPESDDPRETAVLGGLLAAGLEHYHVRKPHWSRERLEAWLRELPDAWRSRLVLHQHHELVALLGLGGCHWRDDGTAPLMPARDGTIARRSCHDLAALRRAFGRYEGVLFGPVFPSLSKTGYKPPASFSPAEISVLLTQRNPDERRTSVFALGGITAENAPQALVLGFDGVAALGTIWQAADPVRAFCELQSSLACHAA
jgi:thiamine-phosphate pyrophosphorylase